MKQVTVVIPFYNLESYIVTAIESVINQTFQDWELLLINDGSTDQSNRLILPYLQDERIKLLKFDNNQGQSAALNLGLANTNTPFLLHLDGDDWLYPNALEILVSEMEQAQEKVGVIGGNINVVLEYKRNSFHSRIVKGASYDDKFQFLLANQSVWPRMFKTSILKEVGGWPTSDPWNGRHAEDIRILSTILERYCIKWVNYPLLYHRKHKDNHSNQIKVYGQVLEWIIHDLLKKWNCEYKPIFETDSEGWKRLIKFEKE